jgi:hypothetical protein
MDQGTTGVTALPTDDAKHAATVEREIESIRGNLDRLVAELDHRRHRLSPTRLAHQHPLWLVFFGTALLATATSLGWLAVRSRQRKQHSWVERSRRLRSAMERVMAGKPIEQPPNVMLKAFVAASSAAAAIAGRRLAARVFGRP